MWMWNYITGADPDEGQEVSPHVSPRIAIISPDRCVCHFAVATDGWRCVLTRIACTFTHPRREKPEEGSGGEGGEGGGLEEVEIDGLIYLADYEHVPPPCAIPPSIIAYYPIAIVASSH